MSLYQRLSSRNAKFQINSKLTSKQSQLRLIQMKLRIQLLCLKHSFLSTQVIGLVAVLWHLLTIVSSLKFAEHGSGSGAWTWTKAWAMINRMLRRQPLADQRWKPRAVIGATHTTPSPDQGKFPTRHYLFSQYKLYRLVVICIFRSKHVAIGFSLSSPPIMEWKRVICTFSNQFVCIQSCLRKTNIGIILLFISMFLNKV